MTEDLLLQVNKPARYIGKEWNVPRKKFEDASIKFCLSFPDLYEVGMSNLGLRIIYGLLNNLSDVVCERVFAVNDDMRQMLLSHSKRLFSLESEKPITEFDFLGFSLDSELDYTNVLGILELGGIPFNSRERDSSYPLIIGGGACTLNPEPMSDFFDLFVLGEAEEVILDLVDVYRKHKEGLKKGLIDKNDLLFEFSRIEGVYVPSFYDVEYSSQGTIQGFRPNKEGVKAKIKKRFVRDLSSAYFPVNWLVPYIQIIHDRIIVEIMRGCPNRCRFCQARIQYYPLRFRNPDNILKIADCAYKFTGYEEMSLIGLSVTDYPGIEGV